MMYIYQGRMDLCKRIENYIRKLEKLKRDLAIYEVTKKLGRVKL